MKAEFTISDDLIKAIAREVAAELRPVLVASKRPEGPDAILSPDQLATLLGVPKGWVYERVSLGELPHFKAGKYLRFRLSVIEKWIEGQSVPASGPPSRPLRIIK